MYELSNVEMALPSGKRFHHQVVNHPGAAVIIPVLDEEQFVMVRQYRTSISKTLLEFPAGTLEPGEKPLHCAKREILEETGFQAKKWTPFGSFYPAPGMSTEQMFLFLAQGLTFKKKIHLDEDEFLEPEIVSFNELKNLVLDGKIVDAKTCIGFFYYLHRIKVKNTIFKG